MERREYERDRERLARMGIDLTYEEWEELSQTAKLATTLNGVLKDQPLFRVLDVFAFIIASNTPPGNEMDAIVDFSGRLVAMYKAIKDLKAKEEPYV